MAHPGQHIMWNGLYYNMRTVQNGADIFHYTNVYRDTLWKHSTVHHVALKSFFALLFVKFVHVFFFFYITGNKH